MKKPMAVALVVLCAAGMVAPQEKPLAPKQQQKLQKAETAVDRILTRMHETRDFQPLWNEFFTGDAMGLIRRNRAFQTCDARPDIPNTLAEQVPDTTVQRKLSAEATLYYLIAAFHMSNVELSAAQTGADENLLPPIPDDVVTTAQSTRFYRRFFDQYNSRASAPDAGNEIIRTAADLDRYITETELVNASLREHVPPHWDQQEPGRSNLQWLRNRIRDAAWVDFSGGRDYFNVPQLGVVFVFVEERGEMELRFIGHSD